MSDTKHFRVVITQPGCSTCGHDTFWTIASGTGDGQTHIGTSWADEETTEDICELMNMAYDEGLEDTSGVAELRDQLESAQCVIRQASMDTFGEELSVKEFAERSSYDS